MEAELKQAFDLFDRNGDGTVSKAELMDIFAKLGGQIKPAEAMAFLKTVDKDKSGSIDFNEFKSLWNLLKNYGEHISNEELSIRAEFDKLDVDGSGFISKEEMLKSLGYCEFLRGDKMEEAKKCLADIDVDGDGKVSYPEFLLVWKFKY